jgi:uroporphyrin-III C-methyltransferase/precorrin-2 dehydrogenase/sirohydrochlorin ferrochelatase
VNPGRTPGYPVELRLDGRRVVVFGEKAETRRAALEAAGARVDVGADRLVGARLVMLTAPVDPALAAHLRMACDAAGALLWVEDHPDLSDVTLPAILESGPVRLAISTGGRSSALSRAVRDALRPLLGEGFAAWAQGVVDAGVRRPRGRFDGRFEAHAPEDRRDPGEPDGESAP